MNKATKGALAASVGVAMLAGGAGTLAYWNDQVDTGGNAINSGHLELAAPVGGACGAWTIDGGATFDPATEKIVPGDVLSRDCSFDITATGTHLKATVAIGATNFTYTQGDYGSAITAGLNNVMVDGVAFDPATDFLTEGNTSLTATETVTFDYGTTADNSTQDVQAVLDAITITATQVHN